jgi:hypothetical protein
VRSIRYLPEFLFRALASVRQARRSSGCLSADVRREMQLIFWTRTLWQDERSMRAFMTTGAHQIVMPKILDWCDEASVTHWQQESDNPPDWPAAAANMRTKDAPRACAIRLLLTRAEKQSHRQYDAGEHTIVHYQDDTCAVRVELDSSQLSFLHSGSQCINATSSAGPCPNKT